MLSIRYGVAMAFIKLPDPDLIKKINFKAPETWVATWFGCGLMQPAPGTWGTLGGLPIALILLSFGGKAGLLIGILLIIAIGLWACKKFETMIGTHDHSMIVVDEVAGICIALLGASLSPLSIVLAFLLFRFFDVLKPWPISYLDKNVGGAWGVMADDLLAGVFAGITLGGLHHYALVG